MSEQTIEVGMLVTHERSGQVMFVEELSYNAVAELVVTCEVEHGPAFFDYASEFKPTLCEYEIGFLLKLHREEDIPWGAAVSEAIESCKALALVTYPIVELTDRGRRVARFEAVRRSTLEVVA